MNFIVSVLFVFYAGLMTKFFCRLAQNTRLVDRPNDRSMHVIPTVRGGGIVFVALALVALPILCYYTQTPLSEISTLFFSILLLATVSFLDDLFTLSAKVRFLAQILVAVLAVQAMLPENLDFLMFSLSSPVLIVPFLIVTLLWSINHFNFMDGVDGICAMQALFLFVSYALLFHFTDSILYQDICLVLILSLLGFLVYNFPPAKIFMGDVGSATLGLIVFCIALIAQQKYQIPIVYWFMLNALFLYDTSVTLIRRMINKEPWLAAHKKHAYQRLKQSGFDTRLILFGQLLVNCSFLILVFLVQDNILSTAPAIAIEISLITLIYLGVEYKMPMPV